MPSWKKTSKKDGGGAPRDRRRSARDKGGRGTRAKAKGVARGRKRVRRDGEGPRVVERGVKEPREAARG